MQVTSLEIKRLPGCTVEAQSLSIPISRTLAWRGAFYTQENDTLADDLVTEAEGPFSGLVEKLRTCDEGPVSDTQLPALVAHLEVRTRHLRQNFLQSAEYLALQFADFVDDAESFIEFFRRKLRNDPSIVHKAMSEELAKRGLPSNIGEAVLDVLPVYMPLFEAKLKRDLPELATLLRHKLPNMARDAAKSGHIKALKKGVSPEVRIEQYRELSYTILETPDVSLILGDSPVIFQIDAPRSYKTLWEKKDILKGVFLPLTPQRVLVGAHSRSDISVSNLPQAIARCALEYFIAHERSEAKNLLKEHIGKDAHILSKSQIEEILSQVLNE